MSDFTPHHRLVDGLVDRLEPVRPLRAPGLRALVWLGAVLALGLALASVMRLEGLDIRLGALDLRIAASGALLTAIAASFAAFATSVPGYAKAWALLPLPPALLWIGASSLGCLRVWGTPEAGIPHAGETEGCFTFLLGVSLPLSILLVVMLRRACPLRPNLTAALGGLAVSAAAAALLVPFHPHEATVTDLLLHAVAILGVIGANGLAGGRLLSRAAAGR